MPLLPWGEYRPDVSDYEGQTTKNINNVVPRGDGYGPFKDFAILSQALRAACRGSFYALKSDGSVAVFAGTSDRLFLANNTDYSCAMACPDSYRGRGPLAKGRQHPHHHPRRTHGTTISRRRKTATFYNNRPEKGIDYNNIE